MPRGRPRISRTRIGEGEERSGGDLPHPPTEEYLERRLAEMWRELRQEVAEALAPGMERLADSFQSIFREFGDKIQASLNQFENRLNHVETGLGPADGAREPPARLDGSTPQNTGDPGDSSRGQEQRRRPTDSSRILDFKLQPLYYDGAQSLPEFLAQFSAIAKLGQWDRKTKTVAVLNALKGRALGVLSTLTEEERQDFDRLCAALEDRFGQRHLANLHYTNFQSYVQKHEQDIPSLSAEIERLALLAFPEYPYEIRDRLMSSRFVDALRDPKLMRDLRLHGAQGFHDTVVRAMEINAINRLAFKDDREQRRGRESYPGTTKMARVRAENGTGCWTCGQEGHRRANCPSLDGKNLRNKENKTV